MNILVCTFNEESKSLPTLADIGSQVIFERRWDEPYISRDPDTLTNSISLRFKYVEHSFPILSEDMVSSLAKFLGKYEIVVELACGEGWLTYWVNKYRADTIIECVDDKSWERHKNHLQNVIKGCAVEYVRNSPDVNLYVLSWPYMDTMAFDIWKAMRKGQELLYIGEDYGGCTASDEFFEAVGGCEVEHTVEHHKSFYGIHDHISLFKKR